MTDPSTPRKRRPGAGRPRRLDHDTRHAHQIVLPDYAWKILQILAPHNSGELIATMLGNRLSDVITGIYDPDSGNYCQWYVYGVGLSFDKREDALLAAARHFHHVMKEKGK